MSSDWEEEDPYEDDSSTTLSDEPNSEHRRAWKRRGVCVSSPTLPVSMLPPQPRGARPTLWHAVVAMHDRCLGARPAKSDACSSVLWGALKGACCLVPKNPKP